MAVSDDGERWERYGDRAIVEPPVTEGGCNICGDPQIIKVDDIYVIIYFCHFRGIGIYNTFACSKDLVNWNIWEGKPLIASELEWENVHAHKPWFIRHNNENYHFYCACNDRGERFIALATS